MSPLLRFVDGVGVSGNIRGGSGRGRHQSNRVSYIGVCIARCVNVTLDATTSTRAAVQQEEGKGERTAVTVHGNDLFANVEETVPLDRAHVKTPEAPTDFTTPETDSIATTADAA